MMGLMMGPGDKGLDMRLTVAKAKSLSKPGMHGDGQGLYLRVKASGAKGWILRAVIDGKRRDIGLGGYPAISLAAARKLAGAHRTTIAEGGDPLAEKRRAKVPTFREAAHAVHTANLPRWRNGKHTDQWLSTLKRYAFPTIGDMTLDRIERRDVLAVLMPIWGEKPETARRVRQRMRAVLKWGMAWGFVQSNVAGEAIDGALPELPRVKAHFRALPYGEVPAALDAIETSPASLPVKLALRFLILTVARSGEARGAAWAEIHVEAKEWRIPGSRMKGGLEHRVPLSGAAMDVLEAAKPLQDDSGLVFPSPRKPGAALSDMALTKIMRDTGLAERATVHGFRSAFRDWAAENTNAPHAVMERSLAHAVGNAVEQAYARSTLIERRRALLEEWARFVGGSPSNVVRLHA